VSSASKPFPTVGLDISALDTSFKAHAGRGTGRYVSELQQYFLRNPDLDLEFKNFSQKQLLSTGFLAKVVDRLPLAKQTVRQQLLLPFRAVTGNMSGYDLLHFPAHLDAPSWLPVRFAVTVLDLIPLLFQELYRPQHANWRFKLARQLEIRSILSASLILAISEQTRRDVNRLLKVPLERIHVTPLGVSENFLNYAHSQHLELELRHRYGIAPEAKVLLYVGGIDQRKNIGFMLKAFDQAMASFKARQQPLPLLVMAGNIVKDQQFPQVEAMISQMRFGAEVKLIGFVPDSDLATLYAMAEAFFFPSLYEGFGLPPLEAMAVGTPVICSNVSSLPEVVGEAALSFTPTDLDMAVGCILELFDNHDLAQRLANQGRKRAASFSWDRTGETTVKAYQSFFKERGRSDV